MIFDEQPLWLIHELNEQQESTIETYKNQLDLIFDDDNKYKLLCIYQFIGSEIENKLK